MKNKKKKTKKLLFVYVVVIFFPLHLSHEKVSWLQTNNRCNLKKNKNVLLCEYVFIYYYCLYMCIFIFWNNQTWNISNQFPLFSNSKCMKNRRTVSSCWFDVCCFLFQFYYYFFLFFFFQFTQLQVNWIENFQIEIPFSVRFFRLFFIHSVNTIIYCRFGFGFRLN